MWLCAFDLLCETLRTLRLVLLNQDVSIGSVDAIVLIIVQMFIAILQASLMLRHVKSELRLAFFVF